MRPASVPNPGAASIATTFSGRLSRNTPPMDAAMVVLPTPPFPEMTPMTYCFRMCLRMRSFNSR
jgi:hypothetical protein